MAIPAHQLGKQFYCTAAQEMLNSIILLKISIFTATLKGRTVEKQN